MFYVLVYSLVGYRKKVVSKNLKNAFPEKTDLDLKEIQRKFYRFLCDVIVETIKVPGLSKKELHKRCYFQDTTIFDEYYKNKQPVIVVLGHHGNWEWSSLATNIECEQTPYALYSPLKNKIVDKFILGSRAQWGLVLVPMKKILRTMSENLTEPNMFVFITDQTPSPKNAHWMTFLNQDTPVFLGAEKAARKYNMPIIYADLFRVKRGVYEIQTSLITDDPNSFKENEITEVYTKLLEENIRKHPETWLWSHKRWKHKR